MFRPASRALLRAPTAATATARGPATRRFLSSTSAAGKKSRSWKSTFMRLGLAAGAVYYYNTSSVFAENPSLSFRSPPQPSLENEESLPTLDSVKPKRQSAPSAAAEQTALSTPEPSNDNVAGQQPAPQDASLASAEQLEEEASQEAAFNPETGEINWDCPCLGGMAHGPCGGEFRAAFSCFVYSEEEPKGIDCIDKFKAMQDCFRQYPEVYGAELEDDDEAAQDATPGAEQPVAASSTPEEKRESATEARDQVKAAAAEQGEVAESAEVVPKAWHESEAGTKPEEQTEK
ncbi:hypothetical protein BJX61DRAFT_505063 [Aspergillus egyptiacus]|nr:hypothetical protein BJX61DRAFT_505063 [Aspergillus egyptiacus]